MHYLDLAVPLARLEMCSSQDFAGYYQLLVFRRAVKDPIGLELAEKLERVQMMVRQLDFQKEETRLEEVTAPEET